MIKREDMRLILDTVRNDWSNVSEKDVAFAILYDFLDDKTLAYRLAYRKSEKEAKTFYDTPRFQKLREALEPFGIGMVDTNSVTKEENKGELIKILNRIDELLEEKKLDPKDAIKMQTDIRIKLNDKFDMEESQKQKRLLVIPAKHDIVCPNTNRECNYWPTKKACCTHYGLIDPTENKKEETNNE